MRMFCLIILLSALCSCTWSSREGFGLDTDAIVDEAFEAAESKKSAKDYYNRSERKFRSGDHEGAMRDRQKAKKLEREEKERWAREIEGK
ncbi:hypothetical protein HY605_05945 [Candidatus Peregrinibacteria bacterium]|nr:hypothetical protein [Candidatus Peregrinibacteria bacterium]